MSEYRHCTIVALAICCALLSVVAYASDRPAPGTTANIVDPGIDERVMTIPLRAGGSVRAIFSSPDRTRATIIMCPGGTGDIRLGQDERIRHADNFVVRTREAWNRQDYAVLIPDTVGHLNLRGQRSSAHYVHLVDDLITHCRSNSSTALQEKRNGKLCHSIRALALREMTGPGQNMPPEIPPEQMVLTC